MPPGGFFFENSEWDASAAVRCCSFATNFGQIAIVKVNLLHQLMPAVIRKWTARGALEVVPSSSRPGGKARSGGFVKDGNEVSNLEVHQ